MFLDNSYKYRIKLSLIIVKHIIKNNNKLNYTQLAYIWLKPKSFHTNKYSQPFKWVLFHIIYVRIKYHKGSHYLHLLIIYLFN